MTQHFQSDAEDHRHSHPPNWRGLAPEPAPVATRHMALLMNQKGPNPYLSVCATGDDLELLRVVTDTLE